MSRSKKYRKSKVSRVVRKAQKIITEEVGKDFVYFEEWYMTIRDNQLVVNVPYIVTPKSKRSRSWGGVHFEAL